MMVPSGICAGRHGGLALVNKSVYICFILVMLAASPMRAAEAEVPQTAVPQSDVQKTIVRVDPRTGKLVRSTIVVHPVLAHPAGPHPAGSGASLSQLVEQASKAHNVDPLLVDSVIRVESNYNPNAVSPKGAQGLMQLMPPTAQMLGVNNSFDPAENIEAGVKYLKYLQDLYKDDRLALAAYNAGPGAVDRFKQVPPYPETQKYVEKVSKKYGDARTTAIKTAAAKTAAQTQAAPAPAAVAPVPAPVLLDQETHPKLEQFVDADGRLHLRTSQ